MSFKIFEDNNKNRILRFLKSVDSEFYPALHIRVNIEDYSDKLAKDAVNYFLATSDKDIAHAAFYCNDLKLKIAYISSISVITQFQGTGASNFIFKRIVDKCRENKMHALKLEVDFKNSKAVKFYKKQGLFFVSRNIMQMNLN